MVTMYGISQCDTIKKAKNWLSNQGIDYSFHDYKKQGVDTQLLEHWLQQLGWEKLINRSGTTWRKLPENLRESMNTERARQVMLENPSIIKRPLLVDGDTLLLGFSADSYTQHFQVAG